MTYATQSDLVTRFGEQELIEQTDRLTGTNVDAAVVTQVLEDASSTIDGYLAGRYVLPLASVPPLLVGLCCDLARYALYTDAAPDIVRDRQKDAVSRLKDIAAGTVKLDLATAAVAHSGTVEMVTSERVFSRAAR
jgi:phage gp36-like protein